jgi:hypothetical protein
MTNQLEEALAVYMDLRRIERQRLLASNLAEMLGDRASRLWAFELAEQEERHRQFLENLQR